MIRLLSPFTPALWFHIWSGFVVPSYIKQTSIFYTILRVYTCISIEYYSYFLIFPSQPGHLASANLWRRPCQKRCLQSRRSWTALGNLFSKSKKTMNTDCKILDTSIVFQSIRHPQHLSEWKVPVMDINEKAFLTFLDNGVKVQFGYMSSTAPENFAGTTPGGTSTCGLPGEQTRQSIILSLQTRSIKILCESLRILMTLV